MLACDYAANRVEERKSVTTANTHLGPAGLHVGANATADASHSWSWGSVTGISHLTYKLS